jgi:sporulation protein YlmC with PRC-barrel domain
MRLSDENLRGRTVIGADGQAVGEVAALFLDGDAWGIQSLQVKLRKEAHVSGGLRDTLNRLRMFIGRGWVRSVVTDKAGRRWGHRAFRTADHRASTMAAPRCAGLRCSS